MTAGNVIDSARIMVNDTEDESVFGLTAYYGWLNSTMRDAIQRRPDKLLGSDGTQQTFTAVTAVADILIFDDYDREALAHGVAARTYENDDDESNNNEMQKHLALYIQQL